MSLRSLKRARHTLWLRLTAWYTGFFLLSAMVLSGVAYVKLWEVMQRYDREAIEIELDEYLAALRARYPTLRALHDELQKARL